MYFPKNEVEIVVSEGDDVAAGETVIARLRAPGQGDAS
jgi:hypothetical protein